MMNNMPNRSYILYVSLFLILLMCTGCEGVKDLYLINCSDKVAIIKLTPGLHFRQQSAVNYKEKFPEQEIKPSDSIVSINQIEYYQKEFNNSESNILINGDSVTIELKPGESLRFALTMWIFYPGKIREPSLNIDYLEIITKSDTCIARNRKEILQLQKDKRFKYDKHYESKIGQNTRQNRKILIK